MAAGKIGSIIVHQWQGQAPPAVKSMVDLIYRPGQAIAAAKILPNQSSESQMETITFITPTGAHAAADTWRSLIGTVVALEYHGTSYGNVLVRDVTILDVSTISHASGLNPDASQFSFTPGVRVTARWHLVRLS